MVSKYLKKSGQIYVRGSFSEIKMCIYEVVSTKKSLHEEYSMNLLPHRKYSPDLL